MATRGRNGYIFHPMTERSSPRLPKWPFYAGDAVLLGLAYLIYWQSKLPMTAWDTFFVVACVAVGALLSLIPFLLEHRATMKLAEADRLTSAVLQIQNLEIIGRQISSATANWQTIQDQSAKTIEAAREIAQGITAEARAFTEFLKKANDTEKNHLRLEVDKLRRGEGEWVQILIRLLDHVYALYQAAVQSGQPSLVEQVGHFQNACRDVARRVGLVPFVGVPGEVFDPKVHQSADSTVAPSPDARIIETLATGYSYQGQLARPALVALRKQHPGPSDLSVSTLYQRHERERAGDTRSDRRPSPEPSDSSGAEPVQDDLEASATESARKEDAAPPEPPESEQEQFRL